VHRQEAQRLFVAYQAQYSVKSVGKVVAVEKLLPEGAVLDGRFVPKYDAQANRVAKAVGYPNYTARLDLVSKVSEADALCMGLEDSSVHASYRVRCNA
jgi:hypothetical protein